MFPTGAVPQCSSDSVSVPVNPLTSHSLLTTQLTDFISFTVNVDIPGVIREPHIILTLTNVTVHTLLTSVHL